MHWPDTAWVSEMNKIQFQQSYDRHSMWEWESKLKRKKTQNRNNYDSRQNVIRALSSHQREKIISS